MWEVYVCGVGNLCTTTTSSIVPPLRIIQTNRFRFLKSNPENRSRYAKLKNAPDEITAQCSDPGFESISAEYLKVTGGSNGIQTDLNV